jgi:hypothetical protein
MKDYLKQTGGHLRTDQREEWEFNKCKAMLCHNNHAERSFAVLRQYKHLYPALSRENLSKLSQSLVNGTHRPGGKGVMAGIALTADPRLRSCIAQLCSVRRKKVPRLHPVKNHGTNPDVDLALHHRLEKLLVTCGGNGSGTKLKRQSFEK